MSRVGKRILDIPQDVKVEVNGSNVTVTGKLGELTRTFNGLISVKVEDGKVFVSRANEDKSTKQLHGTTNSLIENMIQGVSQGFTKEIEIKGVGYKAALKGNQLEVIAGYSHPVVLDIIDGVKIEVPKPINVIVSGIDNQKVGQMAAVIRKVRKPNPYSGKGLMYKGEEIRRKEGKAAAK